MSALQLASHQSRYDLRAFLRNPRARVFTLAFPVVLLLIMVTLFTHGTVTAGGAKVTIATYYVPHIAAMAVAGAALSNLVITIIGKRETGAFKRRRATPVAAWALITGDVVTSVLTALVVVAVLVAIGATFFNMTVSGAAIGVAVLVCVVGAAAFCCLAYALSSLIGTVEAAGPAMQLATLPVYFISGIYIPDSVLPAWVRDIGAVLPIRPLAVALESAFAPATNHGARFAGTALLVVAAWGLAGLLFAVRRFAWVPQHRR